MKSSSSIALFSLSLVAAAAQAAPFPFAVGDVVVERIGSGGSTLSSAATPVFLDEFTASGALVQTIALPTTGSSALTDSGTATSDGYLSRSVDGSTLVLPGYIANTGTASVANTASTAVPRAAGVVNAQGVAQTYSLGSTALSGNNVRSAAAQDANGVYLAGGNGIAYLNTQTGVSTMLTATTVNARNLSIADGQLFYSSGSGTTGIYALGTGLPTAGTFAGTLIAASASPYAFFMADLDASVSGVDTLYVADDTATTGGVRKFSKSAAGAWSLVNTVALSGVRGLTGSVANGQVQLYATNGTGLYALSDTSGWGASLNGSATLLASASSQTVFRGVALAPTPVPEPGMAGLALAALGLMAVVARRR